MIFFREKRSHLEENHEEGEKEAGDEFGKDVFVCLQGGVPLDARQKGNE